MKNGAEPNVVIGTVASQDQVQGQSNEYDRLRNVQLQQEQQQQRPLGFVESDSDMAPTPLCEPLENTPSTSQSDPSIGAETHDSNIPDNQHVIPTESPSNPETNPPSGELAPEPTSTLEYPSQPPTRQRTAPDRRLISAYYARLSAVPGSEEAKAQHILVRETLLTLPGKVTIRHEFGMDEDDVLNVISFKLEGHSEGLEEVAALQGVIGIYPVRTRKRPKALPLGSLQRTRPSLESAHILTGIKMVHEKLGLTGKGIKVGIIDTGVDYKHPALGGCFGPGCKVAYGYDFVGDDYDNADTDKDTPKPDSDPMDCAGHGTHVAGIVAARNEGPHATGPQSFVGVAPDAIIGAYRVFGCEGEVSDDVLLAALKRAYRDGMDIVNLSLGGSSGWPEEPYATACSAYIKKGLHIAIANGNDGEEGLFEDGAPATAAGAIAVGSVDNTHFLGPAADVIWQSVGQDGKVIDSPSIGRYEETSVAGSGMVGQIGMAMGSNEADIPLKNFRSDITYVLYAPEKDPLGCTSYDKATIDRENQVPRSNIVVIIRRGGCTFSEKAKMVDKAKLGGILVYDIVPEQRPLGMSVSGYNISAAGLSFEDATLLLDALKAKDPAIRNGGRKLTARFSKTDQVLKLASGGKISDFSSWGPDARLQYKPDIVAPGGMIYSTFPLAKGGFSTLQGTSMASPYMAGVQALYLAKYGKTTPMDLLRILQSTAVPSFKPGSANGLTSVFQQGGGLISMERLFAQEPPTVVTPTALYLNDTQFQKLDHTITFTNPSTSSGRIWTLVHKPAMSVNGFEDLNFYRPVNQSRLRHSDIVASSARMTPIQFQLGPGASGTFNVHIDPPTGLDIQERWLYSGFLEFQCKTTQGVECGSSLVSYGGMHGRLREIPILNPTLAYPALQLDRLLDNGSGTSTSADIPGTDEKNRVHSDIGKQPFDHKKKKGDIKKKEQKNLFHNQFEHVTVGKGDLDWVQILVSVNFPTSLLTIEAESVCDNDHSLGSGGDRIRLEVGGSGKSRFQIETEEELEEIESLIAKFEQQTIDEEDEASKDMDLKLTAHMIEQQARSNELAFMPSGLYMPYEGYSRIMAPEQPIEEISLLRWKKKMKHKQGKKVKSKSSHKKKVSKHVNKQKNHHHRSKSTSEKKDNQKESDRHHHHSNNKGSKGSDRAPNLPSPSYTSSPNCVPRILGLIPNGFNPWSTRTDSTEENTFQTFSWTGDLLLQNHGLDTEPQTGADGLSIEDNVEMLIQQINGGPEKRFEGKNNNKKKPHSSKHDADKKADKEHTSNLPDGRYRLVVKVLKPWGVRGRASDVERWSSPVIIINRH
ncbi:hypothetical protein FBU30_007000 [Linnemannia zychae]|nr:hypothetical protein FBU30_007000 [Linnemannia zychae]